MTATGLTYLIKTSLLMTYFKTNNCKEHKLGLEQILQTKQWIKDPAVNALTAKGNQGNFWLNLVGNWQERTD